MATTLEEQVAREESSCFEDLLGNFSNPHSLLCRIFWVLDVLSPCCFLKRF